jgi:hypothetical protein
MSITEERESPYEIGVSTACTDGDCGHLHRLIMDPTSRALTHLVIGKDVHSARLVPISLVDTADADGVRLICSTAEFDRLEPAEATETESEETSTAGTGGQPNGFGGFAKRAVRPDRAS